MEGLNETAAYVIITSSILVTLAVVTTFLFWVRNQKRQSYLSEEQLKSENRSKSLHIKTLKKNIISRSRLMKAADLE